MVAAAYETVHKTLKKTRSPRRQYWMIPPEHDGDFVAAMADVLDLYQQPHDPEAPVVCMDETSRQLVGEVRGPRSEPPRCVPLPAGDYVTVAAT